MSDDTRSESESNPTDGPPSDESKLNATGASELDATLAQFSDESQGTTPGTSSGMPHLDGYELLEELGRGGMGVVYRARHVRLDRPVAIKMILAGQFASQESVQRFALEAETAARLDHPCIVPIYEIGQSGEHHFFSMKLIDGRPLSEIQDNYAADQRKSAQLMIQIAEAVQHAHQRGVLHRDLKPANVLIDSEGQPLLTDLGLAKQLDNDTAITQTGLVLGSPGFMAPEQASGKNDVTVAVDVYALGAMLYWLVAGQPPITGGTALEVVQRTIEDEPESLRDVRPDADRDLNLICLKALQKEPNQRYGSVEDFAADLQAWLDGEPLTVKPPTLFASARRWVQRNLRGVAVGIGTGAFCGIWMGGTILLQMAEGQLRLANSLNQRLQASATSWITDAFAWVQQVPAGIRESLPMWITLVSAVCGIATIGLSKPKRGDSGVAASLTAALLSGILAFVISWAWAPIANNAQQAARQDLQLLTDYVFLHPDDRNLAEEVLFERYPGLPDAKSWQRSDLLRAKITSDQTSSIPGAIWTGLIVTAFVASLPLFVSSLLASFIWHREYRGWAFFWRSLEIGFYATTLLFLLCRSLSDFTGAPPALRFQFLSLVVMVAAIAVALDRKPFWWRIPFFIAVFFTFGVNMADSSKVIRAKWIAQSAKSDNEYANVAPFLERDLALSRNRESRFRLATLYAYLGDDDNYLRHCDFLLSEGNFYNRRVAEQTSKVVLLKPELHDDLRPAFRLARWASEQRAHNAWDYICRSLSEYRQGNFEATLAWAQKSRETAIKQNASFRDMQLATTHLLSALAYKSLGARKPMQVSLIKATSLFKPNSQASFETKLTFKLLLDELRQPS